MIGGTKFSRWKAYLLLVGLLLTLTPFSGQAQDASQWKALVGRDRTFAAEVPGTPVYSQEAMKSPAGTPYTMNVYLLDLGGTAYAIQTSVYPPDVNVSVPKANLQAGLDNAAKNMKDGKWTRITWVQHQGLVAVDALGIRDGLEVRNYSVMNGSQILSLTYAGPEGSGSTPQVDRFVQSLLIAR